MAKAKRSKKLKSARKAADPIAKNDQKDEKIRTEKIMPLIEKLSSPTAGDRAMAVSAIISMCEDSKLRSLLLKEKLVQIIMTQSLSDNSEEIVAEAYGLLRNLVAEEGYDVAIFLYRQDILSSIESSLTKVHTSLQNGKESLLKMTGEQRTLVFEYLENVLGLAALMSSADEEIFEAVDKRFPQLGQFVSEKIILIQQVSTPTNDKKSKSIAVPKSLTDSLLELVYILSESNANFISQFQSALADEIIQASNTSVISKVHANGFKYNAYIEAQVALSKNKRNSHKQAKESDSSNDQIVVDILTSLVENISTINISEVREQLKPVIENTEPAQLAQSAAQAVEARSSINAIQVSLELITAIAETIEVDPSIIYSIKEPQDDDLEVMEEDISDEAYFEQSIAANLNERGDDDEIPDDIEIDDHHYNKSDADSSVLFLNEKVVPLCVNLLTVPEFTSRSMAALNNVCWTLQGKIPIEESDWKTHAEQLWTNLATDIYLKATEIEVIIGCIGILSAVATAFKGQVPVEVNNQSVISTIANQCVALKQSTPDDEWTELTTRAVALFTVLGRVQTRHNVTSEVASFLSTLISSPLETPAPVLFESINSIFDLFGDMKYDYDEPIFVLGGWLEKLKELLPKARQAAKRIDKKKNRELRAIGDEATLNLARFIDYKSKER